MDSKAKTQFDVRSIKRREQLSYARNCAAEKHREIKRERIQKLKKDVDKTYTCVLKTDRKYLEIALAMLYVGEGGKTRHGLRLGNSDPQIIRFYINSLFVLYGIPKNKYRVELHLRADQNEETMRAYWSKETGIPLERFRYILKDKRTVGRPTYASYHGVCSVSGGGVEIQRRLLYLAEVLCLGSFMRG